uniref:Uncharacterized protein n=1 Tax=Meloidogyne incognita TaxID=6306 RepID=A0A914KQ49_MELIC
MGYEGRWLPEGPSKKIRRMTRSVGRLDVYGRGKVKEGLQDGWIMRQYKKDDFFGRKVKEELEDGWVKKGGERFSKGLEFSIL